MPTVYSRVVYSSVCLASTLVYAYAMCHHVAHACATMSVLPYAYPMHSVHGMCAWYAWYAYRVYVIRPSTCVCALCIVGYAMRVCPSIVGYAMYVYA
jgi:hypothetical protein